MKDKVKVYTKAYCPYCRRVTAYLKKNNFDFEEIEISNNTKLYNQIKNETGHRTVPIVFVNNKFIGGSDDFFDHIQK